ncbi:MAG TPA: serine hydrolase domain-containing protein [Pyrinomonadaceae bacterium]|nr:serine hydrolase domain-containing protein [Pyrinomonadaceae bacterium]
MKSYKRIGIALLFLSIFLCFFGSVHADFTDEVIKQRLKELQIPGAAIAVIKKGKVVKMQGYGLASLEFNVAVTPKTAFEIGSVSKQMTAAAILLLVEEGKIQLDDSINKHLPEVPAEWGPITIRHLLTHSSGIKNYTGLEGFELSRRLSAKEFIEKLSVYKLEFKPGDKVSYCNSGFNLLAFIIERVSGKKYFDFMRERVFIPLGMRSTFDRDPRNIIPLRASGYEVEDEKFIGRDANLTDLTGAGSIVSTIEDMTKWEAALYGKNFLTEKSRQSWWTPQRLNSGEASPYGFGWRIGEAAGHRLISHTGQTAGFGAAIYRFIDDGYTFIALTNQGQSGMGAKLASDLAKIFLPHQSLANLETQAAMTSESYYVQLAKERIQMNFSDQYFSQAFISRMSGRRIAQERKILISAGPIRKIFLLNEKKPSAERGQRILVFTQKKIFLFRIIKDADGKISSMNLEDDQIIHSINKRKK